MNYIEIDTSMGIMRASISDDPNFPGIKIYLDDVLYTSLEVYEEKQLLRLIGYDDKSDEPAILETLKSNNIKFI